MTTYRTDDFSRWGAGKGSPLASAEFDINFWDLIQRITGLETAGGKANNIVSITTSGILLVFTFQDGTTLEVPIPVLQFRWRGDWAPNTSYLQLDTFKVDTVGLFSVLVDHTSAASFDQAAVDAGGNGEYFKLFGFSGLSGTTLEDLTDVAITSVGDKHFLVFNLGAGDWVNADSATATGALDPFTGDAGSGGLKGLVPAPAAGDAAAGKVLGAGGGWVVPPGGTGASALAGLDDVSIVSPADNDVLQFKAIDSLWHNKPLSSLAGTVTSVASGTGLTGGPITGAGTLSLAPIADQRLLANVTGSSAAPLPTDLSTILDAILGAVRGSIMRRDATGWSVLLPGSAGTFLKSQGTGADVEWDSPAGSGTVTSVASGTGLTGGPITASGTLSLAAIADARLMGNISAGSAAPIALSLTAILDYIIGSTQGSLLLRSSGAWVLLPPGHSGYFLQTKGTGADAVWASVKTGQGGGGTSSTVWQQACNRATTAALPSNTYANGTLGVGATLTATANAALSIDGASPGVSDRILVKDEVTLSHNGIYTVTQVGDGSHPYILTRATDYDQSAEVVLGTAALILSGTANAGTAWVMIDGGTITLGSSSIQFEALTATEPVCTAGQVIGNPNSYSAPGAPASIASIIARAFGNGTSGQVFKSSGGGSFAWGAASGSDVAYDNHVVSSGTTETLSTLTATRTAVIWRSATAGAKTTTIPDATLWDGYLITVKLTEGDGTAHSIVCASSGTIDGQASADITDDATLPLTSITLLADGATNDWLVI
jgi:hypothetical protein